MENPRSVNGTSNNHGMTLTVLGYPTRFIACVIREESAKRLKKTLLSNDLTIIQNDNLRGVQEADVVLLGCKPQMVKTVLSQEGIREGLKGKLLISICAGVTVDQIEETLYGQSKGGEGRCRVVRVMPNTASLVRESMTVIETSTPPLPSHLDALVTWIFTRIGEVVRLPPYNLDASTALCGSGPAFFALILEAMVDGAIAMGLPREEAQHMAAQTMKGTAGLVLNGGNPASVRQNVCSPGGCTIGGLLVLEDGGIRGMLARGVMEATVVASKLGQGNVGVNGARLGSKY
ncbi:MAG: hypothetical protein Q9187_005567 [Circinaria calcarea]